MVGAHHGDAVGAMEQAQHLHDGLQQVALVEFLQQVRDDFGVGVGDEGVAIGLQSSSQLGVVVDDAVVDDGEPSFLVEVGVGVADGGCAVCGPARMGDAGGSLQLCLLVAGRLQVGDFAQRLHGAQGIPRTERQSRRIVSPILQTAKTVKQNLLR